MTTAHAAAAVAATLLRTLDVSAASGLVVHGDLVYVVADDDLHLTAYAAPDAGRRVARVRLFEGVLPVEHTARKAAKPDLEALAFVPGAGLLALGSGSTDKRLRGALLPEEALAGEAALARAVPRTVDLAPLYAALAKRAGPLNVEGAAAGGGVLRLFLRGSGMGGRSAVADLDLGGLSAALRAGRAPEPALLRAVTEVDLGALEGVRLGFSDASPLPDGRFVFAAAAEATPDSYTDGPTVGSVLGVLSADGRVERSAPLAGREKIEGVHVLRFDPAGRMAELLMVADADDPARVAPLLRACLPVH